MKKEQQTARVGLQMLKLEQCGFETAARNALASELIAQFDREHLFHCSHDLAKYSEQEAANHVETCRFRALECQNSNCTTVVSAHEMGEHDGICAHKLLLCERGCGAQIQRLKMKEHTDGACTCRPVICPYKGEPLAPASLLPDHHAAVPLTALPA
ncbi:hypothetical protein T492DRAFT_946970 [Pavlovales sp. CCMP2436]|nr:hypothetical protein T492DRAFT_946970 [Pavlovales sp. CCMP2436]